MTLPAWLFEGWRLANGLLLLLVVFLPLERLFALRRGPRPEPWAPDVAWYFVTSLLPNRLVALAIALALLALPGWQGLWPRLGELPLWQRLPLALLVAELGFYWGHRALHASPVLWRFHALHHGAERLDWLVNTRAHPVDVAFVRLCGLAPLYLLGFARSGGQQIDGLPLGVALAANVWGYLIHANLRWRFGLLEWLIATPRFHHWHHEQLGDGGHAHGNYAALLPGLDALFGTLRLPREGWPARYGTSEPPRRAWLDQLMAPFMELLDRRA
ncbi:MAG: sterol desaturase family protein [Burkholderiales bacterium]|nr:sterol desaturase family protein [Burkholderiales bacterium]